MKQYLDLCKFILENGKQKPDRTNTGTISYFGTSTRYSLEDGFPILTTKKVNFNAILHELLWFISGNTNIQYLVKNNVKIWNEWPFEKYKKSSNYQNETLDQFIEKIKTDDNFSKTWGNLGPVYGKQWRDFAGVDQLSNLIENIKTNPFSRRLIISAWNPGEIKNMLLPPCHAFMQFYVSKDNELSCQLYQRSADLFLGVPFNIASYSLLTIMIAKITGLKPKEFVHVTGDCHIYNNHIEQINIQLNRTPKKLPKLIIKRIPKTIFEFKFEDFELEGYNPDPFITGKVSV